MGDGFLQHRPAAELFDEFISSSTCRTALWSFSQLCEHLQLDRHTAEWPLYRSIKCCLKYWRADALWAKLERRAAHQEYQQGGACRNTTCVIIGAGPCGLRTAVELGFMGARVVVLEKRDSFSRNNVLHLWPFTIHDLRGLGAKKFYGKFCAGSIDHISIRQLQLVLLKVALLLGVEVHVHVEFKNLLEPPEDQQNLQVGWRLEVNPKSHPINHLEFDVIVGADGRRNTLPGFRRKEFRGKLAIAITANFKNRNTTAEAKVEEISGVAFIFNQRFFQELRQETGIDLENIVYYKDDTHYFVMTAKKQNLLDKGVIAQDFTDTELLLSRKNVNQSALQAYARQAADFSTNQQLPSLDFAINHYGQPDVAMFDFTCMYASENAATVRQRHGHQLLVTLVGDSLLEPFWPMGTGIARGFLAALDSAWMVRRWSEGRAPLDILAERESLYRLLPQTTPENLQKNFGLFTVDPTTRYVNVNQLYVTPAQVRHLVDTGQDAGLHCSDDIIRLPSSRFFTPDSSHDRFSQSNQLLRWCQEQTCGYHGVTVSDLTTSWKSGLALCALIHRYRPHLMDFDSLDPMSVEDNTRLAFDVAEQEFGIPPLISVEEMSSAGEPDSLSMVMYLSQFYQLFKDTPPPADCWSSDLRSALITPAVLLSRLGHSPSRKDLRDTGGKWRTTSTGAAQQSCDLTCDTVSQACDAASRCSRVRLMANRLQAQLDESSGSCRSSSASGTCQRRDVPTAPHSGDPPSPPSLTSSWHPKRTLQQQQMSFRFKEKIKSKRSSEEQSSGVSQVCSVCQKRLYVMERLSAEGFFFHRGCFQCCQCRRTLRLGNYSFNQSNRRFYCSQHCDSAPPVRRRTTVSDDASSRGTSRASLPSFSSVDSLVTDERRRSSAVSMVTATPERIELENDGRSSVTEETELLLREVSEETLNRFNLDLDQRCRSESEEEEEEEEEGSYIHSVDEEQVKAGGPEVESSDEKLLPTSPSISSAAGSDVTHCDTPVQPDSTSTASFVTACEGAPPTGPASPVAMATDAQKAAVLQDEGMVSGSLVSRKRRKVGVPSLTAPLVPPFLREEEKGGNKNQQVAFPGNRKEKKKCADGMVANQRRAAGVSGSEKEESVLDSPTLLWRRSPAARKLHLDLRDLVSEVENIRIGEEKQEPTYVPHALAFKQAYVAKKHSQTSRVQILDSDGQSSCPTEVVGLLVQAKEPSSLSVKENMFQFGQEKKDDVNLTQNIQRTTGRRTKQKQLKRLHRAQMVQRKQQQVEEKQKQLEERGVMVEKILRGEPDDPEDWNHEIMVHLRGLDNPALMQYWFQLVQKKNVLVHYEFKLMIFARELELEDQQSHLQQELRDRMTVDDRLKDEEHLLEERMILEEMLEVVEKRDALASLLEDQRLQDSQADQEHEEALMTEDLAFCWS
ncbi:protein-methionine sulfoxide oxidase mical3b-like isoform X2 [Takifugu flavidus]|uniref:protein-methionine sulfoxide oxidase mical3b-like isoform X2 n=1 Tax=Takifugu flavidus TaxID=433684 RepID=UPI00254426CD|nr:protein-methionine sulfoxide oxidase mical3b-like isoform X2 [Takifugu flavidus]